MNDYGLLGLRRGSIPQAPMTWGGRGWQGSSMCFHSKEHLEAISLDMLTLPRHACPWLVCRGARIGYLGSVGAPFVEVICEGKE